MGKDTENDSTEALQAAAAVAQAWLADQRDTARERQSMCLLGALIDLTLERAVDGVDPADVRFTASELRGKAEELGLQSSDATADAGFINRIWEDLKGRFPESRTLAEVASENGLAVVPALEKDVSSGGRGRPSYYYLSATAARLDELPLVPSGAVPPGGVHYRVTRVADLPYWSRWLQGLVLGGWRRKVFLSVMTAGLIWAGLGLWLAALFLLHAPSGGLQAAVGLLLVTVLPMWLLLGPLASVHWNRVAASPEWYLPWSERDAVLQFTKTRRLRPDGQPERRLEIVTYAADCPICDGRLTVGRGGLHWWGRLVGRCDESPREHVFSFDHVTRTGKPLR